MKFQHLIDLYQLYWMFRSHAHQRLAWEDAAEARVARQRAEAQAAEQLKMMLDANPSGSLGHAKLDDEEPLKSSGLL
ncbi:hypothetical protein [Oricola indica]|uniref:hypothetical protein n=1 Tax=Oricola indica TaxID=2872591 RepID=UPI001CC12B2B|nr:hypothetical protein [Oricola indica]